MAVAVELFAFGLVDTEGEGTLRGHSAYQPSPMPTMIKKVLSTQAVFEVFLKPDSISIRLWAVKRESVLFGKTRRTMCCRALYVTWADFPLTVLHGI